MLATHTDELVETFTEDRRTTASVRRDKVRMARQQVAEGGYDRDDLLDRVLDAILDDLAF
jgi:hypothetical protein